MSNSDFKYFVSTISPEDHEPKNLGEYSAKEIVLLLQNHPWDEELESMVKDPTGEVADYPTIVVDNPGTRIKFEVMKMDADEWGLMLSSPGKIIKFIGYRIPRNYQFNGARNLTFEEILTYFHAYIDGNARMVWNELIERTKHTITENN